MGPMHFHRVLHCFLAARMCCFSSVGRTIWIFCATSRIIMRFLLILASGGVGRIFFTRRGQIAAPGLDSVLLAAPGGSWAGFYALWRLLGGDSGFLAASVLDFVLVAAIIRRGFWLGSVYCMYFHANSHLRNLHRVC